MKDFYGRFTKRTLLSILIVHLSMLNFAATYYVATNGNDNNSGTISSPWATWQKGFSTIVAGDVLYIRGGTYATSGFLYSTAYYGVRIGSGHSGSSSDTIKVFAYPGERPVLDCAEMTTTRNGTHFGIAFVSSSFWHIKGLTVKNCRDYFNGSTYGLSNGWSVSYCSNMVIENCAVTSCGDGFTVGGDANYIYYKNCDSYKNYDQNDNGGYADGFQANVNAGSHVYYDGCRSWENSDDGYDQFGSDGYMFVNKCWAFRNGKHITEGNGTGFKLGPADGVKESGIQRTATNCLSFDNKIGGYDENTTNSVFDMYIYNNTSFRNSNSVGSTGFHFQSVTGTGIATLKNNISYKDYYSYLGRTRNIVDHNTFLPVLDGGSASLNPTYTLTDADFLSVDTTGVSGLRQADGSLPDLNFLKLKSTSKLIDSGANVGILYNGSAPDLGAFESNSSAIDNTAPVVSTFTIPTTSSLLTISISSLIATDNTGITGYLLTETSTTPLVGAIGWSSTKPTIYAFSSIGTKTLYAWAKDAAGNVSALKSASVTISAPVASTFTFTGTLSGNVNSPSANFTVTPNNVYTGTITITPSGTGSVGLSAKVLTFSNSSTAQTFSITPTVAGSITLTPTNNGTLTNPANLIYTANAILPNAPTSVVATAGDASALVTFVAPTNTGGSAITGYTVTSIPAGGVDTNAGSTSLTHSIGGLTNGTSYTFTVKANNSVGSSVASIASNSITPKVADVITKQGDIIPSHFKTVWEGLNGLNHMNINVVSATLEDVPLSVDDEIAVFSGSKCVGTTKLTKTIVSSDNTTFLSILASQDDGSGNGFIENDTIVFKIWDSKTQSELQVNGVVYRSDVSTWKTNGKYSPAATAVVEIASYNVITQSIELLKGYNMISTYVSVQNPNVSAVTKSLQDQGSLIKMQDETGNSLENWGDFGGWINQLGSMEETEGYKIQVANNCTLQVTGRSIAMPFDISLKTGWNIISYPRTDVVNAMNVFQTLIDQNKLVKVQDEVGNSIENWGLFGGWKNGIGNLIPGKAYKVKISADAILTFQESYPKSAVVLAKAEETEYYHSLVEGNGTDHMNINITGLNTIGISVGDEIAAFDGALCVATTKITEANVLSGSVSLASSFSTNNQNPDGFKVGDQIQISTWSKLSGDESKVNTEVITGQMKYEKNASVLVKMKSATIATAITNLNDAVKIDVFPNPCQDQVTIRFSKIPEVDSRIEISDISGRKLITKPISGNTEEINLDSFTPGLYLVKSILGKNEYVQKLIVNK